MGHTPPDNEHIHMVVYAHMSWGEVHSLFVMYEITLCLSHDSYQEKRNRSVHKSKQWDF